MKVKKSHHISTEPLLYVIHDRGLSNGDLWGKATDKPRPRQARQFPPKENKNTIILTEEYDNDLFFESQLFKEKLKY